jgi:glycosyltransferase involved in cell wall biosynthesis/GT2 family glycosyltransferase
MTVRILLNALLYGDAVSTHCILLRRRALELGIPALIHAESAQPEVSDQVTPVEELNLAGPSDVLLHQFFNATHLMHHVEKFPGRRVLMYHNITPPSWFPAGSEAFESCKRGLEMLAGISPHYSLAVGMSEFSRRSLEEAGYSRTGIFPLFVDFERMRNTKPDPAVLGRPSAAPSILFVGRVAPNKKVEDLLRLLAACLKRGPVTLTLVGDNRQHPQYTADLRRLSKSLNLIEGRDFLFTGKIPDGQVAAHFRRAAAFVSMSEHEGFCAPLLEAMAFDLPVFVYDSGACAETLGSAGVLFKDKSDIEALATCLLEVLEPGPARAELVAAGRERLQAFSADRQKDALKMLLTQTSKARPPATAPVSVVINTYNRAERLERCLAALSRQTYRQFEVVVVNGPSTDHTEALLRSYGNSIRVVSTPSRVLCVSRNLGIACASGELVAFIDDDAVADATWLANLAAVLNDPRVGAAGGLVYRMNGREIEFRNGVIDRRGVVEWDRGAPGHYSTWRDDRLNTVSGNNCIFRRRLLHEIGGFDERIEYYHDEADVVMRIAERGFRIEHCPEAVVYHEAATSHNRRSMIDLNWFAVYKNTLYCAVKNAKRSKRMTWLVTAWLWGPRIRGLAGTRLSGQITTLQLLRIVYRCARGTVSGIVQGLWASPIYRKFDDISSSAISPFVHDNTRLFSVALLTQNLPEVNPGGIATYTMALARELYAMGCEVHVLSRDCEAGEHCSGGIWFHRVIGEEFETADIPEGMGSYRRNLAHANGARLKLHDVLVRWNINIVESPSWDAEGVLAALERRVPMVVRVHSPLFKVMETQNWFPSDDLNRCCELEGLLLECADAVSGSTHSILELTKDHYDIPPDRSARIPLGLAPPTTGGGGAEPDGMIHVLFAGRLEPRKGIHVLLSAIPAIVARNPKVRFDIVGAKNPGDDVVDAWRGIAPRDALECALFHGELPNQALSRLYDACDVFVAPSLYESFGLVFLEAMSRGKAVVGTRTGGVPEVVRDTVDGFLVEPGDSEGLAEAILKLASDSELRSRLGQAALQRFETEFSARVMAERTRSFYAEVVEEWQRANPVVWSAEPLEMRRHPATSVSCIAETGQLSVRMPAGTSGHIVYGPYIGFDPGAYRAEFYIQIEPGPQISGALVTVDVFSAAAAFQIERSAGESSFSAGPGAVLDVYFEVPARPPADYEFRVFSPGSVPIHVRGIRVCRWPVRAPDFSAQPRSWRWRPEHRTGKTDLTGSALRYGDGALQTR